jgi:hypothetical protein
MFMIEGEWSGYRSSQQRVVHREYLPHTRAKFVASVEKLPCIYFTDGTTLVIRVTAVAHKRLPAINGYGELIRDCVYQNVNSVQALVNQQRKEKASC